MTRRTKLINIREHFDIGLTNHHHVDVVFVHGLHGNAIDYWRNKSNEFWPNWLIEDNTDLWLWSLDYQVESSAWKGQSMPLQERATDVLNVMTLDLGSRPIIFITHSMGGLLIKEVLRQSNDYKESNPEWGRIAEQSAGVVFLSTPHIGSAIASFGNWFNYVSSIIYRSTVTVKELEKNNTYLWNLHQWYVANYGKWGTKNLVFYETQPMKIANVRTPIIIVDRASGGVQFDGVPAIPVDADHSEIAEPVSKTEALYRRISRFVEDCIEKKKLDSNTLDDINNDQPLFGQKDNSLYNNLDLRSLAQYLNEWKLVHTFAQDLLFSLNTFKPIVEVLFRQRTQDALKAVEEAWFNNCEGPASKIRRSFPNLTRIRKSQVPALIKLIQGNDSIPILIDGFAFGNEGSFWTLRSSVSDLKHSLEQILIMADLHILDISEAIMHKA